MLDRLRLKCYNVVRSGKNVKKFDVFFAKALCVSCYAAFDLLTNKLQ